MTDPELSRNIWNCPKLDGRKFGTFLRLCVGGPTIISNHYFPLMLMGGWVTGFLKSAHRIIIFAHTSICDFFRPSLFLCLCVLPKISKPLPRPGWRQVPHLLCKVAILAQAASVCCNGTKCPLSTACFSFSLSLCSRHFSPRRSYRRVPKFCMGF